jgi:hypothetical protein
LHLLVYLLEQFSVVGMMYSGCMASAVLMTEEQPKWIDVAVTIVVWTHVMSPVTSSGGVTLHASLYNKLLGLETVASRQIIQFNLAPT